MTPRGFHPLAPGCLRPRQSEPGAGRRARGSGRNCPGRARGAAGAYLLPEVDGYVGDAQGHQEPDQGPVVRERREFHHSPRRGLTPHTSAAARGLCREARGEWAERGRGRTEAASGGASGRRRRLLLAAAAPSPKRGCSSRSSASSSPSLLPSHTTKICREKKEEGQRRRRRQQKVLLTAAPL